MRSASCQFGDVIIELTRYSCLGQVRELVAPLTVALRAAATSPVVTLTGPRQSAKITLVRALFAVHRYLSLEAPDLRARALAGPRGFLAQGDHLILDKTQRAADLLSYTQGMVDDDARSGRFILTGSQNLLLMESVSQTLAGRTALLRLYPLALSGLRGTPLFDPVAIGRGGEEPETPEVTLPPPRGHWDTLVDGFYPRIHD